ncbi:MAG TPA: hypothetical protein PKD27_10595, partial [Tepidiformaceae bacterium]|nr:hypothetical protein [Tepidiformaceae bacterium]
LQPAELEIAAKNWNTARGEYASERGHLLAFVRTESVETVARFVDYLNNRLDSDEPLPSEFPHLYAS